MSLTPEASDWLASPLASEADLDTAERQAEQMEQAEGRQPLPAAVDLFGEAVDEVSRRKMASARMDLTRFRRRMSLAGIHPLDVMARCMLRAYEDGDYEKAHQRACDLAPYMAPRLSVIATPGAALAPSGAGLVRFTWESDSPALPIEAKP